jgi:3D (Asp-Asp-Asp) domain-containing protein
MAKKRKQKFGWADAFLMGSLAALGAYFFYRAAESDADYYDRPPRAAEVQPAAYDNVPKNEAILEKPEPAKGEPKYRTVKAKVTAYCPCTGCCGPNAKGITGSGDPVDPYDGVAAAVDRNGREGLPYRTMVEICLPGGTVLRKEVDDTGGAMRQSWKKGVYHFDVRMASHEEAKKFGVHESAEVRIYGR